MQGWKLSGFNWVNYPDAQQRVFKSNCKFIGRTHERKIIGKKEMYIPGVHILHPKTKARQERGLERENKQYEIEAEKVLQAEKFRRNLILVLSVLAIASMLLLIAIFINLLLMLILITQNHLYRVELDPMLQIQPHHNQQHCNNSLDSLLNN